MTINKTGFKIIKKNMSPKSAQSKGFVKFEVSSPQRVLK